MEVKIHVPDELAQRLAAAGDVPRQILEAFAVEGYRNESLTLLEVSELLGLGRIETEDLLGRHKVPIAELDEADLDREAATLSSLVRRQPR
jgi:predicted HTH domain antitoxin